MDFHRGVILNIDKPSGWTSFNVVQKVRSLTGVRKVGHSGTLDPMAVGVLLICTGKATKRVPELLELDKEYEAEIQIGLETDTLDITGSIIKTGEIPTGFAQKLTEILPNFIGEIQQIPPMVSALKRNGKPLYKLARQGIQVPLKPRTVRIHNIQLLGVSDSKFRLRVTCSKGTYIRALARDIGNQLKSPCTLSSLIRTRIGPYSRKEAWSITTFKDFIHQYYGKL
jgi:tRNA pseudouridine55 synthase